MRWHWFPKGNPLKDFVVLTLPTTKTPILQARPSTDAVTRLPGSYRVVWPDQPLRIFHA